MATLLVSDIHLHSARPETARRFRTFLADTARAARTLYILGDLFDAWAGDDDLGDPFNRDICAALIALADAGTHVFVMPGNRDLLMGKRLEQASSAKLLADPTLIDLYRAGRFPFDRLVKFYPFAAINRAIADARKGDTIKPVVRIGNS